MKKIINVKRFKIVEQMIFVILFAVIIPTIVSAVIVNNINQHAVRNELRYSALSITEAIASNIETFSESTKDELNQIVLAMKYIPSQFEQESYLKNVLRNSSIISELYVVDKTEKNSYKSWENYSFYNKENKDMEVFKKIDEHSAVMAKVDINVFQNQVFNIYRNDDRQIYIINNENNLIAAHNFNKNDYMSVLDSLPQNQSTDKPILFGEIKNQPSAYYKLKNPEVTVIVNTTHHITKKTINTARSKIILALCLSSLFIMFVVGAYTSYLYTNIRQLFKGIIALSQGNYKRKVRLLTNVFTPYEMIFLSDEFNKMADEINSAYRKLKHTNKELRRMDEFRANLIDTVSHEFRTPLTNIKGYTSRLLRQDIELDEETKQKSLKIIKKQTERLSRMVEDLLVIPDIEGAKLNLNIQAISLADALNDAILSANHKTESELIVNIPDNIPNILADTDRFEQVIINIVENAYKYSYDDTPIIIDVGCNENTAVIKITNEYDYIPNEKLQKLFGKFIRIDDKTTRTTRGTGLGLFIVKGLVLAMNGTIELISTKDNLFSVQITLPLAR